VLGDQAESAFRQSMLISQGTVYIFFSNWLVGSVMALGVVMLLWPLITRLLGKLRASFAAQGAGGR
jgi:putative tricarboxylic transport membrane protein